MHANVLLVAGAAILPTQRAFTPRRPLTSGSPNLLMGGSFRYRRLTIDAWLGAIEDGAVPELTTPRSRQPVTAGSDA